MGGNDRQPVLAAFQAQSDRRDCQPSLTLGAPGRRDRFRVSQRSRRLRLAIFERVVLGRKRKLEPATRTLQQRAVPVARLRSISAVVSSVPVVSQFAPLRTFRVS